MWTAHYHGQSVELFEKGETGMAKVVTRIEMPTLNPTCPALGGPDMDWMFVTSQIHREGQPTSQLGGTLFITKVAVKGVPESRFKDM